jgi:hypothetical protein
VGGVPGLPFVVFAHVYEARVGVRVEAAARVGHVEFADAGFGVADEFEEACGVLHVVFGFSRRWMKKTGGIIIPVCESNPYKYSIYFGASARVEEAVRSASRL